MFAWQRLKHTSYLILAHTPRLSWNPSYPIKLSWTASQSPKKGWTTHILLPIPCHILVLALSLLPSTKLDNPCFHSYPIPALALLPSKGWTTLVSILIPFLLLLCCLQKAGQLLFPFLLHSCSCHVTFNKAGQPLFPFLSHSCSCPGHLTIGWTPQTSTFVSHPLIQTTCYTTSCLAPFLAIVLKPSYSAPCHLHENRLDNPSLPAF